MYLAASILTYQLVKNYKVGKYVISVENNPPSDNERYFPPMMFCHTAHWNKTYMERNVQISQNVLEKAQKIGVNSKSELLAEFARFLRYYAITDAGQFKSDLLELMTEMYEKNFALVATNPFSPFLNFMADAAFQGKHLFKKCTFGKYSYPCTAPLIPLDIPSCYAIPVNSVSLCELNFTIPGISKIQYIVYRTQYSVKNKYTTECTACS